MLNDFSHGKQIVKKIFIAFINYTLFSTDFKHMNEHFIMSFNSLKLVAWMVWMERVENFVRFSCQGRTLNFTMILSCIFSIIIQPQNKWMMLNPGKLCSFINNPFDLFVCHVSWNCKTWNNDNMTLIKKSIISMFFWFEDFCPISHRILNLKSVKNLKSANQN
jgi:uncharacterized membrane protein